MAETDWLAMIFVSRSWIGDSIHGARITLTAPGGRVIPSPPPQTPAAPLTVS